MRRDDIDWKELRGAIIILLLSVTSGTGMLYGSLYFMQQMRQEFNRNDAQFRNISSRYLAVDEEEKLIKDYYPQFMELYDDGAIGREQRLNWIEVLRSSRDELGLGSLSYNIESQSAYTPDYTVNQGNFRLYSSDMELSANLAHEGVLLDILTDLDNEARGIYSPTTCTMQSSANFQLERGASNVTAQCELKWFTIRLADGTEISL